MTEQEWLACDDLPAMLASLQGEASERQLRLFACACCRRVWSFLDHEISRNAVEIAERFADGLASAEELQAAERAASKVALDLQGMAATNEAHSRHGAVMGSSDDVRLWYSQEDAAAAAAAATWPVERSPMGVAGNTAIRSVSRVAQLVREVVKPFDREGQAEENRLLAGVLRDIVPHSAPVLAPHWFTWESGTLVKLAQAIYDERAFDQLPILADALEDAGCDHEQLLRHCRSAGPHVRGCWAVDLILGKE